MALVPPQLSGQAAAPAPTRLRFSAFTDLESLEHLAPAWDALLRRSICNEPVLSPLWMLPWQRIFGPLDGRRLRVASFFDGDRLVGLAPLLWRRHWHRPGIPLRRLEPLGTGERPEDAIHPDYLGVIAECGAEADVAAALAEALAHGGLGAWDELVLPMMDGDNPLLPPLADALRGRGRTCEQVVTAAASYIPLPATWDEYLQKLSSSRRSYVRQSLRRFERWAGTESRLHEVADRGQLEEGKRVLAALHQARWGAGGGKFGSPRFAAFHDAVMPALLDAGALELLWLTVRGEPVAAVYNIVWNGKVYFYQSGRKVDVPAGVRPGIVLHAHAIRRAIDAGRREYDFLSGGEHYKAQLAPAARPIVQFRAVRRCLAERVRLAAERGIGWARAVRDRLRAVGSRPSRPRSAADGESRDDE
jgi:CelD/BcsL family acetyltransferase involved in cellulose biosynthesis